MTNLKIELCKNDIMEIVTLIGGARQKLLEDTYDTTEWEYYFYLAELEEKLVQ